VASASGLEIANPSQFDSVLFVLALGMGTAEGRRRDFLDGTFWSAVGAVVLGTGLRLWSR